MRSASAEIGRRGIAAVRPAAAALAAIAWCALSAAPATGAPAKRKPHRSRATFPADYASAASYRYANLGAKRCLAELGRRAIHYRRVAEARGVLAPVRIGQGVGGVYFHTALPKAARSKAAWEIFDCRLVLALYDYAAILRAHGIDEVIIFSAWRPPSRKWPKGKLGRRHPGALAVDMYRFRQQVPKPAEGGADAGSAEAGSGTGGEANGGATGTGGGGADGASGEPKGGPKSGSVDGAAARAETRWLAVERDFHGRIGNTTCGPKAQPPSPDTPAARTLRALVCEAAAARIFTSMLTPNYNRPHRNHFHFELTPEVKWRLLQ